MNSHHSAKSLVTVATTSEDVNPDITSISGWKNNNYSLSIQARIYS